MGTSRYPLLLLACAFVALAGASAAAQGMRRFQDRSSAARSFGIWRLTHDPAVRDHANYHNTQCWSPDGRYICYTRWAPGEDGMGGKSAARVHVYDLQRDRDMDVDQGMEPRWARRHNWLFYPRFELANGPPYEKGIAVVRLDLDTGRRDVITHGVENLGEADADDRYLFGNQRFRGRTPEYNTVRVHIAPGARVEVLGEDMGTRPLPNPRHPVVQQRNRQPGDFGTHTLWFDLDGRSLRSGTVRVEEGHHCWLGNGEYHLVGNDQAKGRRWNEPYPSNLHYLANVSVGDISPCGASGRYLCGGNITMADLRSGDGWHVVDPLSQICFPKAVGDASDPIDADPKGSPDGTKICFVSTYDLEHGPRARVTRVLTPDAADALAVESTEGFPDAGELVLGREVIGYARKTATGFEELARGRHDTLAGLGKVGAVATPFERRLLTSQDRARLKRPASHMATLIPDADSPLRWQRQTDVYVVVARRPDVPFLRRRGEGLEIIPGEEHRETLGYRLSRHGRWVNREPLRPGQALALPEPGRYMVRAVEHSGLESLDSWPVVVEKPCTVKALRETPAGFAWTRQERRPSPLPGAPDEMRTVHLYDGTIRVDYYGSGQLLRRHDLNANGEATRRCEYENGKLAARDYWRDGHRVSREGFAPDGYKTEGQRWRILDGKPDELEHWWYERGVPVRRVVRNRELYVKEGDAWVMKGRP